MVVLIKIYQLGFMYCQRTYLFRGQRQSFV